MLSDGMKTMRAEQLARFDTWPLISDNSRRLYANDSRNLSRRIYNSFCELDLVFFWLSIEIADDLIFFGQIFFRVWFHQLSFFGVFRSSTRADLPIKENQQRTK